MLDHVIGHVIVASVLAVDSVCVTQTSIVASVNTTLETPVSTVIRNLLTLIIHQVTLVIGVVKVVTTNQATLVSAATTTIHHVLLDNILLVIHATGVTLLHQMHTTQPLEHVIGVAVLDTLDQGIHVSVTRLTVA